MNRASKQVRKRIFTGMAILFAGVVLWTCLIGISIWICESIDPESIQRRNGEVVISGACGIVGGICAVLGWLLWAVPFLWTVFAWRYKCPECGARAKLVDNFKEGYVLTCNQCDYREPTGFRGD